MLTSGDVAQAKSWSGEVLCNVHHREVVSLTTDTWSCWAVLQPPPTPNQGEGGAKKDMCMTDEESGGVSEKSWGA